jgi:hypothetical protein
MKAGNFVQLDRMGVENTLIVDVGVASHEREANGSHSQPRLAIDLLKMKMQLPSSCFLCYTTKLYSHIHVIRLLQLQLQ